MNFFLSSVCVLQLPGIIDRDLFGLIFVLLEFCQLDWIDQFLGSASVKSFVGV